MPEIAEPPAAPTTATPPAAAPETPPAAPMAAFDAAFPEDGLDSPAPDSAPAESTPPNTGKSPAQSKETDSSKSATSADDSAASKASSGTEGNGSAKSASESATEFDPPKVAKPSELRSFAMRMGNRAKKAESEIAGLRQEVQQLKARAPVDDGKTAALSQELAAAKKEAQQFREQLRAVSYQKDPEFQEKFVQPRIAAVKEAYRDVSELLAFEPDPNGVEEPKQRPATAKDFDEIYFAPTTTAAINLAKQKFGDAWSIVFEHRKTIRRLHERENAAAEEWSKTAAERENAKLAETTKQGEAMVAMFGQAREAYAKRNPERFSERNGDREGNELLAKATAFADAVFGGNAGLSPQQVVMRDARAYHWLRAYPRLDRDLKAARAEVSELKKTIEQLRGSAPGKPAPVSEEKAPENEGWEAAFDRAVK